VNDNAARIFAGEVTPEEGCAKIYPEMQQIIDETCETLLPSPGLPHKGFQVWIFQGPPHVLKNPYL